MVPLKRHRKSINAEVDECHVGENKGTVLRLAQP